MLTVLIGKKGTGKTKKLLDLCAAATEASNGVVVFIEKDNTLTFNLSHKTRLACADEYGVFGFASLYGYIAGMCSANYDVTDVFVESTMKIGGGDLTGLAEIQIFLIGIHTASASFLPEITAQQRSSSLRPALR